MVFAIVYCGVGFYLLGMIVGLFHREFMKSVDYHRRFGIVAMSLGLLALGFFHAYQAYFHSTPQGRRYLEQRGRLRGKTF